MGKSTASPEYQPRYKWRLTWPGEVEGDFAGYEART